MRGVAPSRSALITRNVAGAAWLPDGVAKFARLVRLKMSAEMSSVRPLPAMRKR